MATHMIFDIKSFGTLEKIVRRSVMMLDNIYACHSRGYHLEEIHKRIRQDLRKSTYITSIISRVRWAAIKISAKKQKRNEIPDAKQNIARNIYGSTNMSASMHPCVRTHAHPFTHTYRYTYSYIHTHTQ